ncbi:hypothetical protein CCACVL1_17931 [Corchorus capsularis]|uniref:Uncharacterized protein n=1 Tax=Corchorus capsularis TaxID=210143 RepID=A0A1R3HP63_COCAP|nr:hypothetical protein CCACVL1_17931 [Corchorus capsularis]
MAAKETVEACQCIRHNTLKTKVRAER